MKHLLFSLACVIALLACNKQEGGGTSAAGTTPAPASSQEPVKDTGKDNSADVKAAIEHGLALAKAGDKTKVAGWCKDLVLPNHESWFKRVFGDDLGKKVAADYAASSKDFDDDLSKALDDANKGGAIDVRIVRVFDPNDGAATALQKAALEAMKKRGPLYTAKFCQPGKTDSSLSLWSFVVADGKTYLLGKMKAVK